MTLVDAVILDTGGRIVASFELDEFRSTIKCSERDGLSAIEARKGGSLGAPPDLRTKPEKMRDRVRAVIDAKLGQR